MLSPPERIRAPLVLEFWTTHISSSRESLAKCTYFKAQEYYFLLWRGRSDGESKDVAFTTLARKLIFGLEGGNTHTRGIFQPHVYVAFVWNDRYEGQACTLCSVCEEEHLQNVFESCNPYEWELGFRNPARACSMIFKLS